MMAALIALGSLSLLLGAAYFRLPGNANQFISGAYAGVGLGCFFIIAAILLRATP